MNLLGSLMPHSPNFRRFLFRRDAELSHYSGKPFPLPHIAVITEEKLQNFKNTYLFHPSSQGNIAELRAELLKIEKDSVIKETADLALNNIFDFPYKDNIYLGERISWNSDYVSGYEWNKGLSWKDDYFSFPPGTDIINAWLIARLNQLIYLSKAYLATSGEEYAAAYRSLLKNFIEDNPFCTGVNWVDSGEVSVRLLNIIFSLPLVLHSAVVDAEFVNYINHNILLHAIFIENNTEEEDRGYTYLINLAALAASGIMLKDSDYGKKLLRLSYGRAEEAVRKMISPEGVSNIRSTSYHPHILEALIIIKLSLEKGGLQLSNLFRERYLKMFDVLASYFRDDGSIANIGDTYIRRILPFSSNGNAFPFPVGCIESKKGMFKNFISTPSADLLFLKGVSSVKEFNSIKPARYARISYGYNRGGIFILRNDNIHITIDAADLGSGRKKTTGHNDILSFELFYKDKLIFVDPGTYSIYTDPALRTRQRSVKNHNSIYIDDEEPAELEGFSSIKEDLTKPKITEWHSDESEDLLSVQHYAYARFSDPVIIKRIFRLLKDENKIIIRDELFGGSTHQCSMNFVFHPDINVIQSEKNSFSLEPLDGEINIYTPDEIINCFLQDTIYSPAYGKLINTKKISAHISTRLPIYIITEISLK
jgi:hypothetical protein